MEWIGDTFGALSPLSHQLEHALRCVGVGVACQRESGERCAGFRQRARPAHHAIGARLPRTFAAVRKPHGPH